MFGRKLGNGSVIRFEPGQRREQAGGADIDNRQRHIAQRLGDGAVLNPGYDAMTVPMSEPCRRFIAAIMFGQV